MALGPTLRPVVEAAATATPPAALAAVRRRPPPRSGITPTVAAFEEQRRMLHAFFDGLVHDWERWVTAYRLLVEFFDGTFMEDKAKEDFTRLHSGARVEEFHDTVDCLLGAAMATNELGQRQLAGLLQKLEGKMKKKDDDLVSVASVQRQPRRRSHCGNELEDLRQDWQQFSKTQFDSLRTYVFDCDGVLWNITDADKVKSPDDLQKDVLAKVNGLLQNKSKRILFLTNNSHETRWGYVQKLSKLGIDFGDLGDESIRTQAEGCIITAGFTTAKYLKQHGIKRPFVLVSTPGLLRELEALNIRDYIATIECNGDEVRPKEAYTKQLDKASVDSLMNEHADTDAVVVGWDFNLNALKIGVAVNCLKWSMEDEEKNGRKAIPLITCSADSSGVLGTTSGSSRKIRAVGNGAMGQAIASCFDPPLEQVFCGKPSPALLQLLQDAESDGGYGVDLATAVMIGDTIETDIAFANAGGMRSLFVLSGVNSLEDMEQESEPHRKSTWILPSFADV
uniref:Phosphoglycolate phosphatase n=1 Tax=Alexandrium monilatum TaxID=311494 RepID=A0A7S4PUG9_9DINO|mmetsp:Transcript_53629/g.166470  ORF Transcript_53629/g.166470 Transcript_53629/m.166470 type:complete len:508 (+) Transcript_53629:97-1620(+)